MTTKDVIIHLAGNTSKYSVPAKERLDQMVGALPSQFMRTKCSQALKEFRSLFTDEMKDFERFCMIYQLMTEQIQYKKSCLSHNWESVLKNRSGVCMGISELFTVLVGTATDYDVRTVIGYAASTLEAANEETSHAWNTISLNNGSETYHVDVTWDLGKDPSDYEYFLLTDAQVNRVWESRLYPPVATKKFTDDVYVNDEFLQRLCLFYRELEERFAAGMYKLPPSKIV